MRGLVHLFIWLVVASGTAAYAQSPCDGAATHGIADCRSESVVLYAGVWRGQSRIASDLLLLDPTRMYWACCATDAASNPSADLQRGAFLVVLPGQPRSDETVVESCAAGIDSSVDQRARDGGDSLWAPERLAEAMIVGWPDPALADRSAVCQGPPVHLNATKAVVGAVLVVSVPASAVADGE